jgi:hypothetical protein
MYKILATIILIFILNINTYEGDWQYWNTNSVQGKLNKNLTVKLEKEFRFCNDISKFYYYHSDFGIIYNKIGLNYRQVFKEKKNVWYEERRPHINYKYKWKLNNIKLSNRARLEYRIKDNDDFFRYRNKLTIRFKELITSFEFFYSFKDNKLNKNRFYIGFEKKLPQNLNLKVFYIYQMSKKNTWSDINSINTKLKISF